MTESTGDDPGRSFPADSLGRLRPDAGVVSRLRYVGGRLRGLFIGDERHFPIRMLSLFVLACFAVLAVSLYAFIRAEAEPYSESGWIVRGILQFITNPWVYTVLVMAGLVVLKVFLSDFLSGQTARHTRFSKQTVKRFAAEARTTDGCVRLIGTTDHTLEDLRRKLEYAVVNYDSMPDERHDRYDEDVPLADDNATVGVAGALVAPGHSAKRAVPDDADGLEEALATGARAAEGVASAIGPNVPLGPRGDAADASSGKGTDTASDSVDVDVEEPAGESDGDEWQPTTLRDQIKLLRMDAATAMSWSELGRRFLLPAGVTAFLAFTVLGSMWLHPLLYVAIATFSLSVGAGSYALTKAKRRRAVRKLRKDREGEPMNSANALVKPVRTPEGTGYIAFLPGHLYFDFDRDRFVRKVGRRWNQAIHNDEVWPSIQEKFAKRVRQYMPTIREMEQNDPRDGRVAIYNDMADVIRQAENPDGLVPKRVLGERVVQAGPGVGHDPELVAQAYRRLYGAAWQEIDVVVPDADGNRHEMTMVHLRGQPIRDNIARILANYSHEFDPHREPRYPLPEVDRRPASTQTAGPGGVLSDAPATAAATGGD